MLDIDEIRKRAQQASERAADSMKKTFEKSASPELPAAAAENFRPPEEIFPPGALCPFCQNLSFPASGPAGGPTLSCRLIGGWRCVTAKFQWG